MDVKSRICGSSSFASYIYIYTKCFLFLLFYANIIKKSSSASSCYAFWMFPMLYLQHARLASKSSGMKKVSNLPLQSNIPLHLPVYIFQDHLHNWRPLPVSPLAFLAASSNPQSYEDSCLLYKAPKRTKNGEGSHLLPSGSFVSFAVLEVVTWHLCGPCVRTDKYKRHTEKLTSSRFIVVSNLLFDNVCQLQAHFVCCSRIDNVVCHFGLPSLKLSFVSHQQVDGIVLAQLHLV